MKRPRRLAFWILQFVQAILGVYHALFLPVLAVLLLAGLASLGGLTEWLAALTPVEWLLLSPLLYLVLLLTIFLVGAVDCQVVGLLFYRKPRRAGPGDGVVAYVRSFLTLAYYSRATSLWSLPLAHYFQLVPLVRHVMLASYARRVRLGPGSLVFGYLYDPDLTEIGAGAMIGARSAISCHSVTTSEDGFVYVSAPVRVGDRAIVGGEARISLGVRIGDDALIEAGSVVAPFSVIGPGEVWGGNPAVFLRHRVDPKERQTGSSQPAAAPAGKGPPPSADLREAVRRVLADTLGLPVESVDENLSSEGCARWDSLGQMAIGAALYGRFGLRLGAEALFQCRSFAQVLRAVSEHTAGPTGVAVEPLPADPELLPLLDRQQATQALAARPPDAGPALCGEELSVVIAATFTAEPLAPALHQWSRAFGVRVRVEFAGFNQVELTLLAADSPFHRNPAGLNVVLARPEDLLGAPGAAEGLLEAVARFAKDAAGTLVVGTLPPPVSRVIAVDREAAEDLRVAWRRRLTELGVEQLDFAEIVEEVGTGAAGQADLETAARAPYSPRIYQELGIALARLARRCRVPPAKVLAVDADGVLWGGVLAEDGLEGIQLGPDHPGRSYQLFQRQLLRLKDRGALLTLVSRNAEEDVWKAFDQHPGMLLRRQDITAFRINWHPKSQNLKELARELNLGLDAFVFLDDDPGNRLEVEANARAVHVVPLPADPALYGPTLARLWCLDASATTDEDRTRTLLMRQEQERSRARESTPCLTAYLESLELTAWMRAAGEADLPRIAQLTQKTNQFNLSLRRRTVADLRTLGPDTAVYAVGAADRFGEYGLIGACILSHNCGSPECVELETLLISCRALGRGIEDAVLHELLLQVRSRGKRLLARYVPGPRNGPVKAFLQRCGFEEGQDDCWSIDASRGAPLPGHVAWQGPNQRGHGNEAHCRAA
ncbi:MAG: HAD-IIIC family phosphatase [Thermoguttaceae bacterium]